MLERLFVLDTTPHVEPCQAEAVDRALDCIEPDEIEQEVRREVAAHGNHVQSQFAHAHRLADRRVHLRVRIAIREHAKR